MDGRHVEKAERIPAAVGTTSSKSAAAVRLLRTLGDPVLRIPAACVPEDRFGTESLYTLCDELIATMRAENGAGIAAPQIGVSQRIFVVHGTGNNPRYPYKPRIPLTVFINPVIEVLKPDETLDLIEGCLSVPGWRGQVTRYAHVRVRADDPTADTLRSSRAGHAAGTLQHEADHLDGKLFPDISKPGLSGRERLMSWAAWAMHITRSASCRMLWRSATSTLDSYRVKRKPALVDSFSVRSKETVSWQKA